MKTYLLIDTSSKKAQIALSNEENIIFNKSWESFGDLSDKLLPNIERMLEKNKIKPEDLSGVITYLGPGTFTGLRIGITVANAFSYSLNIPTIGIKGKGFGEEKFEIKDLVPMDLNNLLEKGVKKIDKLKGSNIVVPFYGKKPNVG